MIAIANERPIAIKDVATRFKVHPRTVDVWRKRGLESFKLGGLNFTTEEALQRFAQQPQRDKARKEKIASALSKALQELDDELDT